MICVSGYFYKTHLTIDLLPLQRKAHALISSPCARLGAAPAQGPPPAFPLGEDQGFLFPAGFHSLPPPTSGFLLCWGILTRSPSLLWELIPLDSYNGKCIILPFPGREIDFTFQSESSLNLSELQALFRELMVYLHYPSSTFKTTCLEQG